MWSKPLLPQEEAGSWGFPPECKVLCGRQGLLQECVSAFPTRFTVGISPHPPSPWAGVTELVSVYSVHPGRTKIQESSLSPA